MAKRTAFEANLTPPSTNNNSTIKIDSLNLLVDCQVSFVSTTLTSINDFLPTMTTEQIPLLKTLITALTNQFELLTKSIATLKQQQNIPIAIPKEDSGQISFQEMERQRSVVIGGLQESTKELPSDRVADDAAMVKNLFDSVGVECVPKCIYRMGRSGNPPLLGQSRLLKIVLPSRHFQRDLLLNWRGKQHELKKQNNQYVRVMIRESLTQEQLQKRKELNAECKQKRKDDPKNDWIVYAGQVMIRSDIQKFRKNFVNSV